MALSRVNTKVLAQAHLKAKTRRRRLIVLSSRHLQPLSHRTRPPKKTMPLSLDKHALPESRPKIVIKLKEPIAKPKEQSNKEDINEYQDTIGASVQRLQIAHVPATASGAIADELMHFKSSAKRSLDELLKDPIHFVPATKATMSTEPARKRPRSQTQEPVDRPRNINNDFSRKDLGAIGLPNYTGVQCYRRSCLQTLMNLPAFVQWIKRHGTSNKYRCLGSDCLACAVRNLADEYWPAGDHKQNQKRVNEAVRNFDRAIGKLPRCPGTGRGKYEQQDAHEFMIFLLNSLATDEPQKKKYMPRDEFETLFGLKRFSRRTCHNCKHQDSTSPFVYTNFFVNLREPEKGLSFKRYLDVCFREELTDFKCDRCSKLKHTKKWFILGGPEILMVQIVRFASQYRPVPRQFKIYDPVKFPLYLDLSEYCDDDENGRRLQRSGTLRYKLRATIHHEGAVGGGHYTASVVTSKGIENISDMHVEPPTSIKEFLRPVDSNGGTPYVLTYVRDHS